MLELTRFIFSSWQNYVRFLIILWMICPWFHVMRKHSVHKFGKTTKSRPAISEPEKKEKKEQFTVQG